MSDIDNRDLYRIGTVASLTGISVERLRAWERRYNLSPAHKAGKTRFYSRGQLDRLKLIKRLIDQGQPISSLATLDMQQLQTRLEVDDKVVPIGLAQQAPQVGLIGASLLSLEQRVAQEDSQRLEVVARWANMAAFEEEIEHLPKLQSIVLQLPTLSEQPIDLISDLLPSVDIFVIYQFATAALISNLEGEGLQLAKWPLSWREIEYGVISQRGFNQPARLMAPRRYSDEELIAISANANDPSRCIEYFVEAILQLNGLAQFTEECGQAEAQTERYGPPCIDATQARAQLETALSALLADASG